MNLEDLLYKDHSTYVFLYRKGILKEPVVFSSEKIDSILQEIRNILRVDSYLNLRFQIYWENRKNYSPKGNLMLEDNFLSNLSANFELYNEDLMLSFERENLILNENNISMNFIKVFYTKKNTEINNKIIQKTSEFVDSFFSSLHEKALAD